MIERYGSGIGRMADECRNAGLAPPEITQNSGGFMLRFQAQTAQVTAQVNNLVQRLVLALSGTMSRAELQTTLKIKSRSYFTKSYLQPATDAGVIEMDSESRNAPNQRYRLTAAGKELRRQLEAKNG